VEASIVSILIAASRKDPAAMNIADKLIHGYDFKETEQVYQGNPIFRHEEVILVQTETDSVYVEDLDKNFRVDGIIFVSRHSSESGKRSLTVHTTGNPTNSALFGGKPQSLALADPNRMKVALRTLKEKAQDTELSEYTVTLEATHHGPTNMEVPVMFVEIGSSKEHWIDQHAGEAAASSAFSAATTRYLGIPSVGFGGGHYSTKHTALELSEEYAIGHILPKYFFDKFSPEIVELAFKRTTGNCQTGIIDWKGVRGRERSQLIDILERNRIEIVRI
jgi:D-aminoacyl-tRNA deacylase